MQEKSYDIIRQQTKNHLILFTFRVHYDKIYSYIYYVSSLIMRVFGHPLYPYNELNKKREENMENKETILILNFYGQYNQLIARRVRECNVYSEIVPHDISI